MVWFALVDRLVGVHVCGCVWTCVWACVYVHVHTFVYGQERDQAKSHPPKGVETSTTRTDIVALGTPRRLLDGKKGPLCFGASTT